MKRTTKVGTSLSVIVGIALFTACGGGGSSTTTPTAITTSTVTGTVPGTQIEAFGSDGSYKSVTSTNNGTTQHPFSIKLSTSINYHLVMTTNETNNATRVITPIAFVNSAGTKSTLFQPTGDIDLGNIALKLDRADINDTNSDGVSDNSYDVTIQSNITPISTTNDSLDTDNDGIVNAYEDDDGDGTFNKEDSTHLNINDLDNDGIVNAQDVDIDNDGLKNSVDSDIDNDGILNAADIDDDNNGFDDTSTDSGNDDGLRENSSGDISSERGELNDSDD